MDEILNGKAVLVVDDTAVIRMLVADILAPVGVRILEADGGERGMAQYRSAPIIFVTAVDQREVLQWAFEAGADDFIQKPLHAMVLRRRLGNLLQKAAYLKQLESMSLSLRRP